MTTPGAPGPGSLLDGRYRIDAVIARGGMSTVHLATDERLDRHVAVKLLDPALAGDPVFVDRFTLEARSVARLSDPGIVQVFDQGVEDGTAFLVMELVPGGTLRELLDERGPMPPYAAAAVLRPLLGALREAHAAGLVHRDIKPENVLISSTGAVKLADFGLVRAVAESRATSRSVVMGTAAYLSPEQIAGHDTDGRSDLYSLGVLAYEMLTGVAPFAGDTSLAVAYRRLEEDVPPPSRHAASASPALDDLVLHATRRDPSARPRDAREMLAELDVAARVGGFPAYVVPASASSAWASARAEAAGHTAPGDESAFDAADRESGEALSRRDLAPGEHTRVHTRADLAPAPPGPPRVGPDGPVGPPVAPPPVPRGGPLAPRVPRRRAGLAWLALVMIVALLLAVGGWWLGSGRFTTVPSVEGMSAGQAVETLSGVGLAARTRDAYSDSVPRTGLVGTDPAAGERVPRGSDIAVLVSAGPPTVPEIGARRDVDTVSAQLRERALTPIRGPTAHSDSVPVGEVVSLSPSSGTRAAVGDRVTMTISSGPAPVAVPEVVGLSVDAARAALEGVGLRVRGEERHFDATVPGGQVLGTDPVRGTELSRGGAVTVRVSNAIEVPDTRGLTVDEASAALRAAGLNPIVGPATADRDVRDGRVVGTTLGAGLRVDPADPVVRITPSDSVSVPMVLGMRASDAMDALRSAGLEPHQKSGGRSGVVYGQVPLPGRVVSRGEGVDVSALG